MPRRRSAGSAPVNPVPPARIRLELSAPQAVSGTSALVFEPHTDAGREVVVLAPGAGTDLTSTVLGVVGRWLAARGRPVVVFNFPYAEAGRRRPDPPARLERAYADVLRALAPRYGARPFVIGGRSMGGRIASQHSAREPSTCQGLVLLSYPLHPRRRARDTGPIPADSLRTGHWPHLAVPTLFVQGDRDLLCDLDVLAREQAAHLGPGLATTHTVGGADHSFAVRKRDARASGDVLAEVAGVVGDWVVALDAAP